MPSSVPRSLPAPARRPLISPLLGVVAWACLATWFAGCSGCSGETGLTPGDAPRDPIADAKWRKELFESAVENLDRIEEFETEGMLRQIVDGFGQWIRGQEPDDDWQQAELIKTLPPGLRESPLIEKLDKLQFSNYDGLAVLEAAWMRDVSNRVVRGAPGDDVELAKRLFDWTVRNIHLEPGVVPVPGPGNQFAPRGVRLPLQTLLLGRGTRIERGWVFILLARQQRLDAAWVAIRESPGGQSLQPWFVGVLGDGEIYLFEPQLGLPVPAENGLTLDDRGQLDVKPATLREVAEDPSLLLRLDLTLTTSYPVKAPQLEKVVILLEAAPSFLSRRMHRVESQLAGDQTVVLTVAVDEQASRFTDAKQPGLANVDAVGLWPTPYEVLLRNMEVNPDANFQFGSFLSPQLTLGPLWSGRICHLKGKFEGEHGAIARYQTIRLPDDELATLPVSGNLPTALSRKMAVGLAKQDASYWLGLVETELEDAPDYPVAMRYFLQRTIEARRATLEAAVSIPVEQGKAAPAVGQLTQQMLWESQVWAWTDGALYNLGRACEAMGRYDEAIRYYADSRTGPASLYRYGNFLRVAWLRDALKAAGKIEQDEADEKDPEDKPAEKPQEDEPAEEDREEPTP